MGRYRAIKIILIVLIPLIYGWFTWTSASMPFVPSVEYISVLKFVIFPLILSLSTYLIFIRKEPKTGLTGYQYSLKQKTSKSDKFKIALFTPPSLIGFCIAFTFMLQWAPAMPSKYTSGVENHSHAKIIETSTLRKSGLVKIYYLNNSSNTLHKIHWDKNKSQLLKAGSTVTIVSKSNWFGDYVIEII